MDREIKIGLVAALVVLVSAQSALAGMFEVSTGLWYQRSNYSDESYTWIRRIGLSGAYYFTSVSGVEVGFQDVRTRTKISDEATHFNLQDSTYVDRIYSVNWVQQLAPRDMPFQPYFKAGVAQINRDIQGTFYGNPSKLKSEDTLTAVFSFGFRFFISQKFAFRAEGTTYIGAGGLKTWQNNIAANVGLSVFF